MSKKNCELCNKPARMFCESDQASLCFHCDEKVHAANFLVAKHSRTLLCHVCRSPTPWSAHGTGLGPTVSVCHACSRRGGSDDTSVAGDNVAAACTVDATSTSNSTTLHGEDDDYSHSGGDSDEDFEYDDDDSEGYSGEEEEDGENQVVPGSEEDGGGGGPEMNENDSCLGAKRPHQCSEDGCCSSSHHRETISAGFSSHEINSSSIQESDECSHDSSLALRRPSKIRRRNEQVRSFL